MITLPTLASVAAELAARGWLSSPKDAGPREVAAAVSDMQAFFALPTDGNPFDSLTQDVLMAPRFCGTEDEDTQEVKATLPQWPSSVATNLRYWAQDNIPGLSKEQTWAALDLAFAWWAEVCGIIPNRARKKSEAHIYLIKANIDGRGRVLGDAMIPVSPGGGFQSRIRADADDFWVVTGPAQGFIFLPLFLAHEGGHSLGIYHHRGRGVGVMDAIYDERYLGDGNPLTRNDAQQGTMRYGPSKGTAPPPAPETWDVLIDASQRVVSAPQGWRLVTRT